VPEDRTYPADVLREFALQAFRRAGVPEDDAALASDALIEANLRGVDTHGVTRLLEPYVRRLLAGGINPRPAVRVAAESPATLIVDGDNGLGAVAGARAMEWCIERARLNGAAWVGLKNSNHFGASAYYALLAARQGMVGIVFTNSPPAMAPWGARAPLLGTNPIAIAAPTDGEPLVVDMATSLVAKGRIVLARASGQREIPEGWALDAQGRPTRDVEAALAGTVLPLGGHMGSGLALMIDLLCGALTGAAMATGIGQLHGNADQPQRIGHLFGAIDIDQMVPLVEFTRRAGELARQVRAAERAEGVERIFLPGEIEAETRRRRLEQGIPLAESARTAFRALAAELDLSFD
jgi:LDH2 family malate/lactate/ureidoglycolate dehydrogenase